MLENETCFEFVFGHFLLKKNPIIIIIVLIFKETCAHTKTNARGSFPIFLFGLIDVDRMCLAACILGVRSVTPSCYQNETKCNDQCQVFSNQIV